MRNTSPNLRARALSQPSEPPFYWPPSIDGGPIAAADYAARKLKQKKQKNRNSYGIEVKIEVDWENELGADQNPEVESEDFLTWLQRELDEALAED